MTAKYKADYPHDVDKIRALLLSIAAEHTQDDEHSWRKCRVCLALNELEREDVRRLLRPFIEWIETQSVQLETARMAAQILVHAYEHDSRPPAHVIAEVKEW